jgi:transposase
VVDLSPEGIPTGTPARSTTQQRGAQERSTMRSVALDLGARAISFCEVKDNHVMDRATVRSLSALSDRLGPNTPPARVAFEACREAWRVHDWLKQAGHEPLMLDTTRCRRLGIGEHGRKTDRLDAEVMARAVEAGRLPLAHVLSEPRRELRYQQTLRRSLVQARAHQVAAIRETARARGHLLPSCATDNFLTKLRQAKLDEATRALVQPLDALLETLDAQIAVLDTKLVQLCQHEPVITQLMTAPGVGPVVAAAFVSVIDEAGRFRNAHQVQSYLGLVPLEDTTGGADKRRLGKITKQGNGYVRALLVQAAWTLLRLRNDEPLKQWAESVAKRRGKSIAVVALARRLAGVLWAMWRSGTVYDPDKLGLQSAQAAERSVEQARVHAVKLAHAAKKYRRLSRAPVAHGNSAR